MIELGNNFPLSRYRHCYSVGKKMYAYAHNILGWSDKKSKEMFVLGNLHDIGYEMNPDSFLHDDALADVLDKKYKYSNEVRYHSYLQTKYKSPEMDLLYFADMTVDGMGNWVTFEERMYDLISRHGEQSDVVRASFDILNYLKAKGFDDRLEIYSGI